MPQIRLNDREASRLSELNQLIRREASPQTRSKVHARWAAEDRMFADTESGKTQQRDDHGRYADGGGKSKAPDFKKAAKWLNDHALKNMASISVWSGFKRRPKKKGLMSVIPDQLRTLDPHLKMPISPKYPKMEITRSATL